MFHDWKMYDIYQKQHLDLGVYDKSNIPITKHNMKLYTMHRTQVNMSDFVDFVQVDIHDQVRDNILVDEADLTLQNITENTIFTKV
jgi:hypothetical protein